MNVWQWAVWILVVAGVTVLTLMLATGVFSWGGWLFAATAVGALLVLFWRERHGKE